jgi:hypothetical protein
MALPPVHTILMGELQNAPLGLNDLGTVVPVGFRWIVTDIVLSADSSDATARTGAKVEDSAQVPIFEVSQPWAVSGETYHWVGRQVLENPDSLSLVCFDAGWSVRVTGYQLTLP